MTDLPKSAVTYFIADLHLAQNRPDITACFLLFLKEKAPQADALYILGDLFEYWLGDDDDSAFLKEIADALLSLSKQGTPTYFIHGNRDFLLGKKFAKRAGMTLLPESCVVSIYQHKMLIMHGDTLCTDDVSYQKFRQKSRSWWWQTLVKALPLKMRKNMAEKYRAKSAEATSMKSEAIMDVTQHAVEQALTDNQCELLIHGHTHRPDVHNFTVNNSPAQRIVLGDWYEQGSYLVITPDNITLATLPL